MTRLLKAIFVVIPALVLLCSAHCYIVVYADPVVYADKFVEDKDLKVQLVAEGLKSPTSMEFLGPDDILVLEKNNGTVKRVINGEIKQPLLDVEVANKYERGMLGIAIAKSETTTVRFSCTILNLLEKMAMMIVLNQITVKKETNPRETVFIDTR